MVLDEAGRRAGSRRVTHSKEGLEDLKAFLLSIAKLPEELVCVVETNHGLLIAFLLEAGIPVYPVNPKTANQLRKTAGRRRIRLMPICWQKSDALSLPICVVWPPIVHWWLS